jgi:MOSC domain-containing protein
MADGVRVTSLHRYPVKACAGEPLDVVEVRVDGLRHDRGLAVVGDGVVLTQREHPVLARVRPVLDDATARLTLSYDGRDPVDALVDTSGRTRDVRLFDETVAVVDQAPELSAWFGSLLGRTVQLVGAPAATRRTSPGAARGQTVLSDEGTVSLHSEASLERLNELLAAGGEPRLPADRFRANVVVGGCPAHAEDEASTIQAGDLTLAFARLDERCAVTTVDQRTGERRGPEPLRTLATYRRLDGAGVAFGVYAAVTVPGTLRLGDPVVLHRRS